ncbi:alpha-ketoglutarate-dependent dioxygenase AlkB, partial [Vibrio cholerae]|uniref:alpha-ketoglutarate-dependent dioxygenase AlkB n=1 Tax=Vibrio cholerae TaxID=666 RepID=UPI0009B50792
MAPNLDLFADDAPAQGGRVVLGPQSVVLRGYALARAETLLAGVDAVTAEAPFRQMQTPGGYTMSVALTNCGSLGWTSDAHGYRYTRRDPLSGRPWPDMPAAFAELARDAAAEAGFPGFAPDACLVNRYEPGSRLSLHQDRNERDYGAPIVSVSLGMPAVFLFGGLARGDKTPADRDYLAKVVAAQAGIEPDAAQRRVEQAIQDARKTADEAVVSA